MKSTKNKQEIRSVKATELRATDTNGVKRLSGYAIRYGQPSVDLGGFIEVCQAGMLTRTLREQPDVLCLRDHVVSQLLGRTTASTLSLRDTPQGLQFDVTLPDTVIANDTYENVKTGNLSACSFGFSTRSDSWSQADEQVVRTLLDVDLAEVSVTSFAAYPATSVNVRSCPPEIRSLLGDLIDFDNDDDDTDDDDDDIDPITGKKKKKKSDDDDTDDDTDVDIAADDFRRYTTLQIAVRRLRA